MGKLSVAIADPPGLLTWPAADSRCLPSLPQAAANRFPIRDDALVGVEERLGLHPTGLAPSIQPDLQLK